MNTIERYLQLDEGLLHRDNAHQDLVAAALWATEDPAVADELLGSAIINEACADRLLDGLSYEAATRLWLNGGAQ